jgi:hypothetical protein
MGTSVSEGHQYGYTGRRIHVKGRGSGVVWLCPSSRSEGVVAPVFAGMREIINADTQRIASAVRGI